MLSGGSTVTSETNITVVSGENGVEATAENDSNETEATLVDEEETDTVASEISITTSETSTDSTVTETEPADEATSVVEEPVDISPVEKAKKKSIFRRNKKIDESGSATKIAKKLKVRLKKVYIWILLCHISYFALVILSKLFSIILHTHQLLSFNKNFF